MRVANQKRRVMDDMVEEEIESLRTLRTPGSLNDGWPGAVVTGSSLSVVNDSTVF